MPTDNSSPAPTSATLLPSPSIIVADEDGAAANWLLDIAELYSGVDRWHIRRLAQRLRHRHDEGIAEKIAEGEAVTRELHARLGAIEAEEKHLADERGVVELRLRAVRGDLS